MTADETFQDCGNEPVGCSVVILYETEDDLARATVLCDRIMEQHWNEFDIHVNHWPFEKLTAAGEAPQAATDAAHADVLVVATEADGSFSQEFLDWTELLLGLRNRREGALVGLFAAGTDSASREGQLHQVALRAGMDYLNRLPPTPRHGIPDQLDWCTSRAETLTGTLDEIIRRQPGPSRQ